MPEVEYSTTMPLPRAAVWAFVKDMDNWAPFLTGYQRHEKLDDTDSVWTLKGDVGILIRIVELRAHITEWTGPERVCFTLTGLNENVDGGGTLVMANAAVLPPPAPPRLSLLARFFRWLFALLHGSAPARASLPAGALAGGEATTLTFTLRMDAGGPTGPLVNAMLGPALLPAAEALANKIAAHLEQRSRGERLREAG